MNLDGLWLIEFFASDGTDPYARPLDCGVVKIDGQRMQGGNSQLYWSGRFQEIGGKFRVIFDTIDTHFGAANDNIFRFDESDRPRKLENLLGGIPTNDRAFEVSQMVAAEGEPGFRLTLRFTKKLP